MHWTYSTSTNRKTSYKDSKMKFELFIITNITTAIAITTIAIATRSNPLAYLTIVLVELAVFIVYLLIILQEFTRTFTVQVTKKTQYGTTYAISNQGANWGSGQDPWGEQQQQT